MDENYNIKDMDSDAMLELFLRLDRSLAGTAPHVMNNAKTEIALFSVLRKNIIERMEES